MSGLDSPFLWIGSNSPRVPLLLTCPHSGETPPPEAAWLRAQPEAILLTDVDRFVDRLYAPAAQALQLPLLATRVHRYAVDLNRYPDDVDADSVEGATHPSGAFTKGFHWVKTTQGARLMPRPIDVPTHRLLVARYHDAFHAEIESRLASLRARFPGRPLYHLDCHSMPSVGTGAHADAGQRRPEVCLSDFRGQSASPRFLQIVVDAFLGQGFEVSVNQPYQGGRITQRYGQPARGVETIQIELNRALYMDEASREKLPGFDAIAARLTSALGVVLDRLENG